MRPFVKEKSKSWLKLLTALLIISNLFWVAGVILNFKYTPYKEIRKIGRTIKQEAKKVIRGKEGTKLPINKTDNIIESSVLPLSKTYFSLKANNLINGAVALELIEDKVLILDSIGGLFAFDGIGLEEINLEPSKNNKLIDASSKVVDLVYDKIHSSLIICFHSKEEIDTPSLIIGKVKFDSQTLKVVGDWSIIFKAPLHSTLKEISPVDLLLKGNDLYLSGIGSPEKRQIQRINLANSKTEKYKTSPTNVRGMGLLYEQAILAYEYNNQKGIEEIYFLGNNGDAKENKQEEVLPFFAFAPSIEISSILQLNNFNGRWDNDLLVGSRKMQSIYRLKLIEDRVVFNEPMWIGSPIKDMVQHKEKLILLTDDSNLITLKVEEDLLKKNLKGNDMMAVLLPDCASCHQFKATTPLSMAPSLKNIFNKKIGSDGLFTRYTETLKNHDGVWDEENLRKYISNPGKFIPGTAMPSLGLSEEEVDYIIATLTNPLRQ